MFLAYTPVASLSTEERVSHARDVSLAALVGEDTMNFGEVLALEIVKSLEGTGLEYLLRLMQTLHTGDVDSFNTVLAGHQDQIAKVISLEILKQKISLAVCINGIDFKELIFVSV